MSKKIVTTFAAGIALAGGLLLGTAANADEKLNAYGGWSESEGYFINTPTVEGKTFTTFAVKSSTKPDSHVGQRLTKIIDSAGTSAYAAKGTTKWEGKYHYTNARMELSNGTVKTTSGRQWGYDKTTATSPYYVPGLFENPEARTYWGY